MKLLINSKDYGYHELTDWLQNNVGPLLNFKPIIFARGKGWYLEKLWNKDNWYVIIDDTSHAMNFAMKYM